MATSTSAPADPAAEVAKQVAQGKLPPNAMTEMGISGTANYAGQVLTEPNVKLYGQLGFGTPGAREWGEFERILRTDPAVAMAMEFVKAQMRDALVSIEPASELLMKDRELAIKQAEFCEWNLLEACEPGWAELIQQMAGGMLTFGFALHEIVLENCEHPLLPGSIGKKVKKLAERLPVSIHPNGWIEKDGDLAFVRQLGPSNGGDYRYVQVDLPAEKLLLNSWNRSGNNYLGYSAARPIWYLCKQREEIIKTAGITVVREGAGIPVATCDDTAQKLDPQQQKNLETLMANLVAHENANVVMPPGWKLNWVFSGGANKGSLIAVYNALGLIILQQFQAQQLVIGTGTTGSKAASSTHNTASESFVLGVVAALEGNLNGIGERAYTGLLRKLVQANWGPQLGYPKIKFSLKKSKLEADAKATAVQAYVAAGVLHPTIEDENSARDDIGWAPIDEDARDAEIEKNKPVVVAPPPAGPGSAGPGQEGVVKPGVPGSGPGPTPTSNPRVSPAPKAPVAQASRKKRGSFEPRRPLRDSEKHLALADIDKFLDDAKDSFEKGARPLILELLGKAIPGIRDAMAGGDVDHDAIANLPLDTTRLDAFVGSWLDKARAEGYGQVASEKRKASAQTSAVVHAASEEEEKDPPDTSVSDDTDDLIDAQKKRTVRGIANRLRAELEDTAIDAERTGESADDVVSDVVQSALETKALQRDAGSVVMKAFNMGREEFARERGNEVESVELSAILDDDTCDYCEDHDGDTADFDSPEHDAMTPPLRDCDGGPRCRCVLVYTFEKPDDDSGDDAPDDDSDDE